MRLTAAQCAAVETLLAAEWKAGYGRTSVFELRLLRLRDALGLALPKAAAGHFGEAGVPFDIGRALTPAESRAWQEANAAAQLRALFAVQGQQLFGDGKPSVEDVVDLDIVYGSGDRTPQERAVALCRLRARAEGKGRGT